MKHKDKFRRQLQYQYIDYGKDGSSLPRIRTHDDHDDFPDALALACYGQYGGGDWHEMPPDMMDPDLEPVPEEEKPENQPYYLGSLRLS